MESHQKHASAAALHTGCSCVDLHNLPKRITDCLIIRRITGFCKGLFTLLLFLPLEQQACPAFYTWTLTMVLKYRVLLAYLSPLEFEESSDFGSFMMAFCVAILKVKGKV